MADGPGGTADRLGNSADGGPAARRGDSAGIGPAATADADALADAHQARGEQPGLAYGIVADGSLLHACGLGQQRLDGPPPDADTVFRIASMTKSFTAAAVLALRDRGALTLDDPAEDYVPELRGTRRATPDSPPISIRHLLTMTAGFPTDDPWGDRQQGLALPEFSALLAAGPGFAWAPGTRFEYSNLGYALLGRIISAASGTAYADFVRDTLLHPLGMRRTGFEAAEFAADELAGGHQRHPAGWSELEPDAHGAFAPMGGVFTCVSDLARWVSGFAAAFPAGEEDTGGPHPLRRATRRQMQLPQVAIDGHRPRLQPGNAAEGPVSYGFGLFVEDDPAHGRIVQHSGGYPGFGSHMRWHPATGIGVIVLANGTYAPAWRLAARLLDTVLLRHAAVDDSAESADHVSRAGRGRHPARVSGPAPAPGTPWPETISARREVMRLLDSWDDAAAGRLFSPNVAWDEPFAQRRQDIELIRERLGGLAEDPDRSAEFDSPAHCRWWLRGNRGSAAVEIRLTPEPRPRVQQLRLAVPPATDSPLSRTLAALITLLNDGATDWPAALPVSGSLDPAALLRQFRAAGAWAGHCRPGALRAGNGATSATVELDGQTARLTLAVTTGPDGTLLGLDIGWPA